MCWPNLASTEIELASHQHQHAVRKAKSASKALWIEKSNSALCKANGSPISTSIEAHVVSNCETTSAFHRAQLHVSCEAKGKATIASLSTAKDSVCEAISGAFSGTNSEATSLKEKALYCTKAPSAETVSPS